MIFRFLIFCRATAHHQVLHDTPALSRPSAATPAPPRVKAPARPNGCCPRHNHQWFFRRFAVSGDAALSAFRKRVLEWKTLVTQFAVDQPGTIDFIPASPASTREISGKRQGPQPSQLFAPIRDRWRQCSIVAYKSRSASAARARRRP